MRESLFGVRGCYVRFSKVNFGSRGGFYGWKGSCGVLKVLD